MENRVNISTILCCIALLSSCIKVGDGDGKPPANGVVTIQLDIPSISRAEATDQGTAQERYIGMTQVIFFAPSKDKTGVVERIITFDVTKSSVDGQSAWDATTKRLSVSGINTREAKGVCVVANATKDNGYDMATIVVGRTTEGDMVNAITKSTTLPSHPTLSKGMLMSYMVKKYDFSVNYTLMVPLVRQLVKINLTVKINQTFAGHFPTTLFDPAELMQSTFLNIYNINTQSFLYGTTPPSAPITSNLLDFMPVSGITKSASGATVEWHHTIYTYENPATGSLPKDKSISTWFVLNLPYKNGSGISTQNYYKFYIDDKLDGINPHKTVRNHIYDLTATVSGFGGATPDDGRFIDVTTTVLDWSTVDMTEQTGRFVALKQVTDLANRVVVDGSSLSEEGTTLKVTCNTNIGGWYTVTSDAKGNVINTSSVTPTVSAVTDQTVNIAIAKLEAKVEKQSYTVNIYHKTIAMETIGYVKSLNFTQAGGFIPNLILIAAGWPIDKLPASGLQLAKRGDRVLPGSQAGNDDLTKRWKTVQTDSNGAEVTLLGLAGSKLGMGKISTDAMLTNGGGTSNEAAAYCRLMGVEWYLPSLAELKFIWDNQSLLGVSYSFNGNIKESSYWSSTASRSTSSWGVSFFNGAPQETIKTTAQRVRCLRSI